MARSSGRPLSEQDLNDLGFGSRVASQTRLRFLNRDGSFNVARTGLSLVERFDLYTSTLTMSWTRFNLLVFASFLAVNAVFGLVFVALGDGALRGLEGTSTGSRYLDAFFFSVETFTTVGYGHIVPATIGADIVVTLDAFLGVFGFALATGILFARFSRPTARIAFSATAIVAPYLDMNGFMFRLANKRSSQLVEIQARVLMVRDEEVDGATKRRFYNLLLERTGVVFLPLTWTVVHPIDAESPLHGLTPADLRAMKAEFLVLITGTDEMFSQQVHARTSYRHDEVIWGARFADPFLPQRDGVMRVDLQKLDDVVRAPMGG